MNKNLEDIKIGIKSYLNGCAKYNSDALKHYLSYKDWQIDANKELERRRARFLDMFSMQELSAVANGELDMAQLAEEVNKKLGHKD